MAGSSKRTTVGLALVAIVFIIVIIILCLVPDPCHRSDPRPHCRPCRPSDPRPECRHYDQESQNGTIPPSTKATTTSVTSTPSTSTPTSTTETSSTTTTTAQSSTTESTTMSTLETQESSTLSTKDTSLAENVTDITKSSTNSTTTVYDFSENVTTSADVNDTSTTTSVYVYEANTTTSADDIATVSTTNGTATTATSSSSSSSSSTYDYEASLNSTTSPLPTSTTTNMTDDEFISNDTTTSTMLANTTTSENATFTSTTPLLELFNTTTTMDGSTTEMTNTTTEGTTVESTTQMSTTSAVTMVPRMPGGVCNSPICKEVARRMLDIMDPSDVNPCENFYQFSCGGVLDDKFLKPEDPQVPANDLIKEALTNANRSDKNLHELLVVYDSCMNYTESHVGQERLAAVAEAFNDLGYRFNPRSKEGYKDMFPDHSDVFDLSKALARMMKRHFTPFFDIMVDVAEERDRFQYKMTLPAFTSPFTKDLAKGVCAAEYKSKAETSKREGDIFNVNKNYDEYLECVGKKDGLKAFLDKTETAVRKLNLTGFTNDYTVQEQIISQARFDLNDLYEQIAEKLPTPPEARKAVLNKTYEIVTIKEIDEGKVFPNTPINFKRFFEELLGDSVKEDTTLQVYFKDVFTEMFKIIDDFYDMGVIAMQNVLLMLWSERVYSDLVEPVGPSAGSHDYCFNVVTSLMDDYVSYLYLDQLPRRQGLKAEMDHMIRLSKLVALNQLEQSRLTSKNDFMEKLDEMTGEVANLQNIEYSLSTSRSHPMPVMENDFVENYKRLMQNYRKRLYSLTTIRPDDPRAMWSLHQFIYNSNGVTSYGLNKFLIPYAAMSPPLYYHGVPGYINYAGIGHMIAHELMHGYDITGMEYNAEGKERMQFEPALTHPTECLSTQLNEPVVMNSSTGFMAQFTLHNNLGINELLADSAATKLAWDTYQHDLEQQTNPKATTPIPDQPFKVASRRRRRDTNEILEPARLLHHPNLLDDMKMVHLEQFTPLQLYFIKTAQNQCSHTGEIDIISVMENEHLPAELRVNLMVGNDPAFLEAFGCPVLSKMMPPDGQCPFNPTGKGKAEN